MVKSALALTFARLFSFSAFPSFSAFAPFTSPSSPAPMLPLRALLFAVNFATILSRFRSISDGFFGRFL